MSHDRQILKLTFCFVLFCCSYTSIFSSEISEECYNSTKGIPASYAHPAAILQRNFDSILIAVCQALDTVFGTSSNNALSHTTIVNTFKLLVAERELLLEISRCLRRKFKEFSANNRQGMFAISVVALLALFFLLYLNTFCGSLMNFASVSLLISAIETASESQETLTSLQVLINQMLEYRQALYAVACDRFQALVDSLAAQVTSTTVTTPTKQKAPHSSSSKASSSPSSSPTITPSRSHPSTSSSTPLRSPAPTTTTAHTPSKYQSTPSTATPLKSSNQRNLRLSQNITITHKAS